jgi:hypothetical protein
MKSVMDMRRLAAAAAIGLVLLVSGAAKAQDSANQNLAAEFRLAESLELAIRDSEKLGLFTKLDIKNRFDEVRTVANDFKRGTVAEYDLKKAFTTSIIWLEHVFANRDPALRIQLAKARSALWKIAVSQ